MSKSGKQIRDKDRLFLLQFFTEIGIINQLADAELRRALGGELGVSGYHLLTHFSRQSPAQQRKGESPSHLAKAFQMSKPSMTALVGKLAAKGFVTVKPDPKDARAKTVHITAKGRDAHAKAVKRLTPVFDAFLQKRSVKGLREIYPALQDLRLWLDEERNTRDGL